MRQSDKYLILDYISCTMSEVISIRISKQLKAEMKAIDADWASIVRTTIEEKVREERKKRAIEVMDASRAKTRGVKFDSTEVVRRMRDAR